MADAPTAEDLARAGRLDAVVEDLDEQIADLEADDDPDAKEDLAWMTDLREDCAHLANALRGEDEEPEDDPDEGASDDED